MTTSKKIKLKYAMQNHNYLARKQLTEGESINKKINNRQSFEMFIQMYSIYAALKDKFQEINSNLGISNYELIKFQQMIS